MRGTVLQNCGAASRELELLRVKSRVAKPKASRWSSSREGGRWGVQIRGCVPNITSFLGSSFIPTGKASPISLLSFMFLEVRAPWLA